MILAAASVGDYAAVALTTLGALGITFGAYRAILAFRLNGRANPGPTMEPRLDALEARADAHDEAKEKLWEKLDTIAEDAAFTRGKVSMLPCLREAGCPHGKET